LRFPTVCWASRTKRKPAIRAAQAGRAGRIILWSLVNFGALDMANKEAEPKSGWWRKLLTVPGADVLVLLAALLVVRLRLAQKGAESAQNQFRSLLGDPVANAVDRLDLTVRNDLVAAA
jgi:hypothetical protein